MTWQLAQLRALPWRPERPAGSRHRVHDRAFISCVVLPINELLPWVPRLMCGVGQVILNMGYAAYGRYMSGEGSDVSKMLALAGALDFMVSDSVLAVRMGWLVPQAAVTWVIRVAHVRAVVAQINKFRYPFVGAKTIVMLTYFRCAARCHSVHG